jgi:hypothetical protein
VLANDIETGTNRPPECLGVSPATGSGASARLVCTFADPDGVADLAGASVLIAPALDGRNACWVHVDLTAGTISLASNDTLAWSAPATLGAAATLDNAQCRVDVARSATCDCSSVVTLELSIVFKPAFIGTKTIYLRADDTRGAVADYSAKGTWTVTTTASTSDSGSGDGGGTDSALSGTADGGSAGGRCGAGAGLACLSALMLTSVRVRRRAASGG